jgi:hypothetical protein
MCGEIIILIAAHKGFFEKSFTYFCEFKFTEVFLNKLLVGNLYFGKKQRKDKLIKNLIRVLEV